MDEGVVTAKTDSSGAAADSGLGTVSSVAREDNGHSGVFLLSDIIFEEWE